MSIVLQPITRHNWRQAIKLNVEDAQKHFVAPNLYSIAESKFYSNWEPFAIYDGETMVGFLMWGVDPDSGDHWIIRLMIDKAHQGNGYGRAAMEAVMRRIIERHAPDAIFVSFEPQNAVARTLYTSLGFADTGRIDEGEVVYRYQVAGA